MNTDKLYTLPDLPYGYGDLAPYMSEEQLTIHHQKHHQAYVKGANDIFEKLVKARADKTPLDFKAMLKALSFNIGGHVLHSLFWTNLAPANQTTKEPVGELAEMINAEFGSFERFKEEFTQTAMTVEGSGWAALVIEPLTGRLVLMQIEKHNTNIYPGFKILLVLDMFEHAYYLDCKNDKAKFVENFWQIVNWVEVGKRLK